MKDLKFPHIRWNLIESKDTPDTALWIFLIINYPREIKKYTNRIYKELQPIISHKHKDENIAGSDLSYQILEVESQKGHIEWSKVYEGRKIKDESLYPRQARDGLEKYVSSQLE